MFTKVAAPIIIIAIPLIIESHRLNKKALLSIILRIAPKDTLPNDLLSVMLY